MAEMLAARSNRDFVAAAPARPRRTPKRQEPGRAARMLAWSGRFLAAHPREILVGALLLAGASAIVWNAVAVQTKRHPSPLFGQTAAPPPLPPARPAAPAPSPLAAPAPGTAPAAAAASPAAAVTAPVPPQKPAAREGIADLIRATEGAPRTAAPVPAAAAKPAPRDEIGDLIRSGGALVPPANVGRADAPERVAAGQRALTKLGYGPLKADGVLGLGTRQAIERFERDRRLPVTGEVGSRTARELAAQSGLPVE